MAWKWPLRNPHLKVIIIIISPFLVFQWLAVMAELSLIKNEEKRRTRRRRDEWRRISSEGDFIRLDVGRRRSKRAWYETDEMKERWWEGETRRVITSLTWANFYLTSGYCCCCCSCEEHCFLLFNNKGRSAVIELTFSNGIRGMGEKLLLGSLQVAAAAAGEGRDEEKSITRREWRGRNDRH